jgi:hypothetical protein
MDVHDRVTSVANLNHGSAHLHANDSFVGFMAKLFVQISNCYTNSIIFNDTGTMEVEVSGTGGASNIGQCLITCATRNGCN